MAATGFEIPLPLNAMAPTRRSRGLLLDAAVPMPGAWTQDAGVQRGFGLGVRFVPWGVAGLTTLPSDCTQGQTAMATRNLPAIVTQPAFSIYDGLKCTTLSVDDSDLVERVSTRMRVMGSYAMAVELVTGEFSGGTGLRETAETLSVTASTLEVALVRLEGFLAAKLWGASGVIHLTAGLLGVAFTAGAIVWDGSVYRTATGHIVVGDAGFTGLNPVGLPATPVDQAWIYATGDVYYSSSLPEILGDYEYQRLDLDHNRREVLEQAYGVWAFDPDAVGAALVDLTP